MKHYDEFPGYENIPTEEVEPGVFRVLEPFTILIEKWFADDEYRNTISEYTNEDETEFCIYYYTTCQAGMCYLSSIIHDFRNKHKDAFIYAGSFMFAQALAHQCFI